MTKAKYATAPTALTHGVTDPSIARNLRVVDAETKEEIGGVISADADASIVTRYAVEDGNLVRDGERYRIVEEKRAIRIEWIDAPPASEGEAPANQGDA